ncbi:MAG: hypothetical protein ACOVRN_08820 [Flavobacterium sp.]
MNSLYPFIYTALFVASAITLMVGIFTKSTASIGAFIAGYSVLAVATVMLLVIVIANVLQMNEGRSALQTLGVLLGTSGGFLLLLGVVGFLLYQSVHFKRQLVRGRVAPRYQAFNIVTVVLLLLQIALIVRTYGQLSKLTTSILYFIGTLTAMSAISQYSILLYYSTDGFHLRLP